MVTAGRALPGPDKSLAGTVELIKDRHNLLTVFGIWIHVLSGLEQREIFGTKLFLQFVYLLGQALGFLAILVPISLIELITEIKDLAIGLGFSPSATDDVEYSRVSATKSESRKEYSIQPTSPQALRLLTKRRFARRNSST